MRKIKHNNLFGYALSKRQGIITIKIGKKINKLSVSYYWARKKYWPELERKALKKIKGKSILDIGAGTGRHAIYLKDYNLATIEKSPILYNILRKCKLNPFLIDITKEKPPKKYENILLLDNNIGLTNRTKDLLKKLKELLTVNGQLIIVANNVDKTKTVKIN